MGRNIWIIKTGEPVPSDGSDVKLMRAGLLADLLARRGHRVTWWTSTVHHQNKTQRFARDTTMRQGDTLTLQFLHGPAYRKSVSLARILNQFVTARSLSRLAEQAQRPDVILCCLPTLDLCEAAIMYGRKHHVPVIIDVRDLWPDAFMKYAPPALKPVWRLMLTPLFQKVRRVCAGATAIVGVSEDFVNWGVAYAQRRRNPLDRCFPFGYASLPPDSSAIAAAEKKWGALGIGTERSAFVCCFFGFFGWHFELDVIIEAARRMRADRRTFSFVLCGTGDKIEHYRALAIDCGNVLLPGWIGAAEIWTLMRKSSVGLAPYKESPTFSRNMPNKPIEYMSAGLPIVSSLKGMLSDMLAEYQCGVTYNPGDVDGLVNCLRRLYDNPALMQGMSENASRLFRERYAAEKVYGEMVQYIEQVSELPQP